MEDYRDYTVEEVTVESKNYDYCDICGRQLEEGQDIYRTATGKIACDLVELIEHLCGHKIDS